MINVKKSDFIKSASHMSDLPNTDFPEFAFIGRSNVGKSSLMNMLLGRKGLVKTSKKPGKTILLNYFLVNDDIHFVDMPGYGFAKRSKSDREAWRRTIEVFLQTRKQLKTIFLLIDARHGVQENDEMMLDFLEHYKLDFVPVFTKIDKLPKNRRNALKSKNKSSLFVSAISAEGKEEMWECIESFL